jgi:hypothetical protein
MDSLDLNVEHGRGIRFDTNATLNRTGKRDFVGVFCLLKACAKFFVVGGPAQTLEFLEVVFPAMAQTFSQQRR